MDMYSQRREARRSVKDTLHDNKNRWRDKFKQQCNDRMKQDRQNKIDKIRENQILENEWEIFKQENEQAMRNEGIDDIDNLIEESMFDQEAEMFLREEEEHLYQTMVGYQAIVCVNCQNAELIPTDLVFSCPHCGFYATEMCLATILQTSEKHSLQCHGPLSYSFEYGTDNSVIAECDVCYLWDMFKM